MERNNITKINEINKAVLFSQLNGFNCYRFPFGAISKEGFWTMILKAEENLQNWYNSLLP